MSVEAVLSACVLMGLLLNGLLLLYIARWVRRLLERYPAPSVMMPTSQPSGIPLARTAPTSDPNADIISGLQEWPQWTVDLDKWQEPSDRLPGDPTFRVKI